MKLTPKKEKKPMETLSEESIKSLIKVQSELNAPKNQRNDFGGYNYRNAEDIMAAAKPLLAEHGLLMLVMDEIIQQPLADQGDYVEGEICSQYRTYVQSSVYINSVLVGRAYARETLVKKGMDAAQVTGAASSYARKYALNGVFLIDDVKDADSMDNSSSSKKPAGKKAAKKAAKKKDMEWHEWTVPFKKSPNYGRTLGDIATAGEKDTLEGMLGYLEKNFDPASRFADQNQHSIDFMKTAIENCSEKVTSESVSADAATTSAPSDGDESVPF